MQIQVLMLNQDDPSKCTAAKLVRFGLAMRARKSSKTDLILDPFSESFVLKQDRDLAKSIIAVDCSWEYAQKTFLKKFQGLSRSLPPLLAGNPVNYSKVGKLTTAEAIAGALYVMEFSDLANSILDKFKWGPTFFELNKDLLAEYSNAKTTNDVFKIAQEFGLELSI